MKTINVLLIGLFVILLSSCSKDSDGGDGGFDPSECDTGNGIVTADISGSPNYRYECALANYMVIQDVKLLTIVNLNIPSNGQGSLVYDDYLALAVNIPSSQTSGCTSDLADLAYATITYWEDLTISQQGDVEDHPGFYQADEEDLEICFDELTAERAKGTFNGTLRNNFGDTKTITNGQFDFKF